MSWVPSIQVLTEKRLALHNEPGILYSFWMVYVDLCTKLGWKALMTSINFIFLRDYWTKWDGVFAEMQIISYSCIILKHIQIDLQFWKLLMLKVRLHFFFDKRYTLANHNLLGTHHSVVLILDIPRKPLSTYCWR